MFKISYGIFSEKSEEIMKRLSLIVFFCSAVLFFSCSDENNRSTGAESLTNDYDLMSDKCAKADDLSDNGEHDAETDNDKVLDMNEEDEDNDVEIKNKKPEITSTYSSEAVEDTEYVYEVVCIDADGDDVTLSVDKDEDSCGGTVSENRYTFTPDETKGGTTCKISIKCSDGKDDVVQNGEISISEDQKPPVFSSTPLTEALEEVEYKYEVVCEDADGDAVTIYVDEENDTCAGVVSANRYTFTPDETKGGTTCKISIKCSDGKDDVVQNGEISISEDQKPPVFSSTPLTEALEEVEYKYEVVCEDADGDAVIISVDEESDTCGGVVSENSYTFTPDETKGGTTCKLAVKCSDGKDEIFQKSDISIVENQKVPAVTSIPPLEATEEVEYVYEVVCEDGDSDTLTISVDEENDTCGGVVSENSYSFTPDETKGGTTCKLAIKCSDGKDEFPQMADISIIENQKVPAIISIPTSEATEDINYIYEVVCEDGDSDDLTIVVDNEKDTCGGTISENSYSFIPDETKGGTICKLALKCSDGRDEIFQESDISIIEDQKVPTFTSIPSASATEDVEYVYEVVCEDEDGDVLTFSVDEEQDTCGGVVSENSYSFTPDETKGGTTCKLAVKCSDGKDDAVQTADITIEEDENKPVITSILSSRASKNIVYKHEVICIDEDGDDVTISIKSDEETCGGKLTGNTYSFETENRELGSTCTVSISCSDNKSEVFKTVEVTVVNNPHMVANINNTTYAFDPGYSVDYDGVLYFTCFTAAAGRELCRLDETEEVVLVADVNKGRNGSNMEYFKLFNGKLYFSASDGKNGKQLWRYDSITNKAEKVSKNNQPENFNPQYLVINEGKLYFSAYDKTNKRSLWRYDDAVDKIELVNGSASLTPKYLLSYQGFLYFKGYEDKIYIELFRYSSISGDVEKITSFGKLYHSSYLEYLTLYDGKVYFSRDSNDESPSIWEYDPETEQSREIKRFRDKDDPTPYHLKEYNGKLYFIAEASLWSYDSINDLVEQVNDKETGNPISYPTVFTVPDSSKIYPMEEGPFAVHNGSLYLKLSDDNGSELWRYNSETGKAEMAKDILEGRGSSRPKNLISHNGFLYFSGYDGKKGRTLWRYNDNTTAAESFNISQEGSNNSTPAFFVENNGALYFSATSDSYRRKLFVYDDEKGSVEIIEDTQYPYEISFPVYLTSYNNELYFTAEDEDIGEELFKYNQGTGSIELVEDILIRDGWSSPKYFTSYNGHLYFMAEDYDHGRELWRHNGETGVTEIVKDIKEGGNGSEPAELTVYSGELYFEADDGKSGRRLWKYNSESDTVELLQGPEYSYADYLTVYNGSLYFRGNNKESGGELWRYTAETKKMEMVKDINSGTNGSRAYNFIVYDGSLYFGADDGINGKSLWRYNSETDIAESVLNVAPGIGKFENIQFKNHVVYKNQLYFQVDAGNNTYELWRYNSKTNTGEKVEGLYTEKEYPNFISLGVYNGKLYFNGLDKNHGSELFVFEAEE